MKKQSKHPLNNVDLACLYIFLRECCKIGSRLPRAHEVRKFMYLQRHGSMKGWHRGWYCEYFKKQGKYIPTPKGRYVDVLWVDGSIRARGNWALTLLGLERAEMAYAKVKKHCHCDFFPLEAD